LTFVHTPETLLFFMNSIQNLPTNPPSLYLDLEGDNLSKDGTLTILSVFVPPINRVFIIDVQALGGSTFSTTAGTDNSTFKSILESPLVPKVFFDVRNDSNALFFHYNIALQGVQDVQLMENAQRVDYGYGPGYRAFLAGLGKCIEQAAGLNYRELERFNATKNKMKARFDAARADASRGVKAVHVFAERPLDMEALSYCADDVCLLPRLRETYWGRLGAVWKDKVELEAMRRVRESQTEKYLPKGKHKAYGPW
jgi:exonuclease 3'-5' domain-containing protein 1